MRPILQALRLFGREPGLWKYALRPLAWAALAYVSVVLILAGFGERVGAALTDESAFGASTGAALGTVLAVAFGGAIYLGLVALISGFGFDSLSREVEERQFGNSLRQSSGFAAGIADGAFRAVLAALLGIVSLCLSVTVIAPWLVASLLILMDATAPALLRRGVGFDRQFAAVRRLPGAMPFALVSGALVLIPVLNVLALPILIAAGTILVAEGDASFQPLNRR